jgi:hypothetical protein
MAKLAEFQYAYTHGPLDTEAELLSGFATGNCRRAVQDFFYKRANLFLVPEQIYIPQSYEAQGSFVVKEGEPFALGPLKEGDVLYAQKLRSKSGRLLDTGPEMFDSRDEWLFGLHNAVYLGEISPALQKLLPEGVTYKESLPYIWHATVVAGGTGLWEWDMFAHYYLPVSAKRLVG